MARIDVQPGPELQELIRQGNRATSVPVGAEVSSHSSLSSQPAPPSGLNPDAYLGLPGEIVGAIEPHTESDPTAILFQLLGAVGNAIGRGLGFEVEADKHNVNLFVAIVGDTASGRKGSSWGQARRLVEQADAPWAERVATGLSSGEGAIWQMRDPVEETRKARKGEEGDDNGLVTEVVDPGVEDKRLLVIEPELASVLERMGRDGNTLSEVLRSAWDGTSKLDTLVKTNRATATNAHLSLIGHITVAELRRKLTATEQANGFANRILWVYSRRSKLLPFGGELDSVDWTPFVERLREAIRLGSITGAVDMDSGARDLWVAEYPRLSAGSDGLLGAVTARGPAQVRRLACIYAVLDPAPVGPIVTAEHLRAALALWDYSHDSAAFIFGEALGDPTADAILAQLRSNPEGMTRKEISDAFGRHRSADDLTRALAALEERRLAYSRTEPTKGRPAVRWFACTSTREQSEVSETSPADSEVSSLTSHTSQGCAENGRAS